MVIIYALDTQHYFHALSKGEKFKDILILCDDLFNKIKLFAWETDIVFDSSSVLINTDGLLGEIDLLTNDDVIWEIKCSSDISLKHILQVVMYNILYYRLDETNKDKLTISANFINFLKGEKITFDIPLSKEEIIKIKTIFLNNA